MDNIPGGPRYITQTDLIFLDNQFVGTIFTIDPRISEFNSYEERNKFLINSFTILADKFDKKYKSNDSESNNFVRCPDSRGYDYESCTGSKRFYDKDKSISLEFSSGAIYQTIAWKKHFDDTQELIAGALLSIYSSHVEGLIANEEYKKKALEKKGVRFEQKTYSLSSAEIEILYSETP